MPGKDGNGDRERVDGVDGGMGRWRELGHAGDVGGGVDSAFPL
jgi:hypothetical protein